MNLVSSTDNVDIIEISVIDTGIGIPKENLESIFVNFEQAINNQSGEYGGTGLGLSITSDIVLGHGGDLALGDSPLGGLRVVIKLPI